MEGIEILLKELEGIIERGLPEEIIEEKLCKISTSDVRIEGLDSGYLKLKFKPDALALVGWLLTSPPLREEWKELKIIRWDDRNRSRLEKIASKHCLRIYPVERGAFELMNEGGLLARLDEYGRISILLNYRGYGKLLRDLAELYGIDP